METIGNFDNERQSGKVLSNGYESIDNMGYVSIQCDHNDKYINLNYKNAETTNDETPNKEMATEYFLQNILERKNHIIRYSSYSKQLS